MNIMFCVEPNPKLPEQPQTWKLSSPLGEVCNLEFDELISQVISLTHPEISKPSFTFTPLS